MSDVLTSMELELARLRDIEQGAHKAIELLLPEALKWRLEAGKRFGKLTPKRREGIAAHLIKQLGDLGFEITEVATEVQHD